MKGKRSYTTLTPAQRNCSHYTTSVSDKGAKNVTRRKQVYFTRIHQEHITIISVYIPNNTTLNYMKLH